MAAQMQVWAPLFVIVLAVAGCIGQPAAQFPQTVAPESFSLEPSVRATFAVPEGERWVALPFQIRDPGSSRDRAFTISTEIDSEAATAFAIFGIEGADLSPITLWSGAASGMALDLYFTTDAHAFVLLVMSEHEEAVPITFSFVGAKGSTESVPVTALTSGRDAQLALFSDDPASAVARNVNVSDSRGSAIAGNARLGGGLELNARSSLEGVGVHILELAVGVDDPGVRRAEVVLRANYDGDKREQTDSDVTTSGARIYSTSGSARTAEFHATMTSDAEVHPVTELLLLSVGWDPGASGLRLPIEV